MEFYQVEETNTLRRVIGWIVDIAVVISLAWFVVYGYGTQVRMAGQSMTPQLLGEDVVLMDRLTYDFTDPARFDIVVFEYQHEENCFYIKRVIGLPGETVQIVGDEIFINGEVLEEDYGYEAIENAGLAAEPVVLGENEYFVLGDNRASSEDSRNADVGNVKREYIYGKAWFVISFGDHFGWIKHKE